MEINNPRANFLIALLLTAAIVVVLIALVRPAAAGGDAVPPPEYRQGRYPTPVQGPPPGASCLMTALQLGYQTGRRELAYSASEACAVFAGSDGFVLPYGYYGPYVPSGWVPPNWALPRY